MGKEKDFKLDISIVAILMLFMVSTAGTFENPGMQVIIEHWAARGVPVSAVRMMSFRPLPQATCGRSAGHPAYWRTGR